MREEIMRAVGGLPPVPIISALLFAANQSRLALCSKQVSNLELRIAEARARLDEAVARLHRLGGEDARNAS